MPTSLHMQQFQISDCEQCTIFLFDSNAGVYIDESKYSRIFIGPSQSSVFIRDCHSLTVICCTKQFRVRDCTDCVFFLWCESQPIIQSSHSLTFKPFPQGVVYPQIKEQFIQAGLGSIWNNNWFDIYDFTPNKFQRINYQCIQGFIEAGGDGFIEAGGDGFIEVCRKKL